MHDQAVTSARAPPVIDEGVKPPSLDLGSALEQCYLIDVISVRYVASLVGLAGGLMAETSLGAGNDVVLDWNRLFLDAIRRETTAPTLSTRNLALLNLSLHDAVNGVERNYQSYRYTAAAPAGCRASAAAMGAGYEAAVRLYPSLRAEANALLSAEIETEPDDAVRAASLAYGMAVTQAMIEDRANDGANTEIPYIPSAEPGEWRRTPPFFRPPLTPHWRYVRPFALPEIDAFVPPPPPALDSPVYAFDYNEVKSLGAGWSPVRTPEQTEIAVFWSDFSYTAMPPGHWVAIVVDLAAERAESLGNTARLMALLSLAEADAAIVCWEAKYRYNFWRPVTAIQRGDEDGNPLTEGDPVWASLLVAPNFPEYVSGHSTFAGANSEVLARFFGTDAIPFTAHSDSLPGVIRSFTSFSQCADEIGMSRIYGGIHFSSANWEGKRSGRAIGGYVSANWLLPLADLPRLLVVRPEAGQLRLCLHGVEGRRYAVQGTADWRSWHELTLVTAARGGAEFSVDTTLPWAFFRVAER